MGIFNSGKNDKVEKVEKYEGHSNAPPSKSHRHSRKARPNNFNVVVRPVPQLSSMPMNGNNYFPFTGGYSPSFFGNYPQIRNAFPSNSPYDLSKYVPSSLSFNPFGFGQNAATNFAPMWMNGVSPFNDRSPFQQPASNMYQQNYPPLNNGYMQPMNY